MTADGKNLYVANGGDAVGNGASVLQYDVGAGGLLLPKTPTAVASGKETDSIVVLPDQGPTATFSATGAPAGSPTSFDASASSDPDGTVARYDWTFGDGTATADGGPTPTHVYAVPGSYTVILRVTDDEGCSSGFVFTGQTAYCNASPQAITTRQITITKPSPSGAPSGAEIAKANITRARISSKHHSAAFGFNASSAVSGFQCALVKQPKKKHKQHPKPHFTSCESPKTYEHLNAGKYTFEVRAMNAAGPGNPAAKNFTIT
jgi:PKD domain